MVNKGNHPHMAARFRLENYYNLPRLSRMYPDYNWVILFQSHISIYQTSFINVYLVGGLEDVLFLHILEIIIPTD